MHTQKSNSTIRFAENPPLAHLEVNFSVGKAKRGSTSQNLPQGIAFQRLFLWLMSLNVYPKRL